MTEPLVGPCWAARQIGAAAQEACLLEARAFKPGNVSPGRPFADMCFEDFERSAEAVGSVLAEAGGQTVGTTVLRAVQATRHVTSANTNLGIVLLLAPLARAAAGTRHLESLRANAEDVLAVTTVDDARLVYEAIRLAAPGGLGDAPEQAVASEPAGSLREVMRLAAARDDVAHEYATGYGITFDLALPVLAQSRRAGLSWEDAVVQLYLTLLSRRADTLIARKAGRDSAERVSARAGDVLARGGVLTADGRAAIVRLDMDLRDSSNRLNPGTTADLTAAALFVHLLGAGAS